MRTRLTVDSIESYCRASSVCVVMVIVVVVASADVHEGERPFTMVVGTGSRARCLAWRLFQIVLFCSLPCFARHIPR